MKNPFMSLNVDSVLKLFNKAITRLETIEEENRKVALESAVQASYYHQRETEALSEADRASKVRKNITELING